MTSDEYKLVDPFAPRFGQAITATLLAFGIALSQPVFIYLVALILSISVISRWKLDLYSYLWRNIGVRVFGASREKEPASPHRFSKLVGMAFTVTASIAFLVHLEIVAIALAGIVVILAFLAASTGFCLGCRMYRQVRFFQKINIV